MTENNESQKVTITITGSDGKVINTYEGVDEYVLGFKRGSDVVAEKRCSRGSDHELTDFIKVACVYQPLMRSMDKRHTGPALMLPDKRVAIPRIVPKM